MMTRPIDTIVTKRCDVDPIEECDRGRRTAQLADEHALAWDPDADRYDPDLWSSPELSLDEEARLMFDLTNPAHRRRVRFSPGRGAEPNRWWCDLPKKDSTP